jgi:hypothetical protein
MAMESGTATASEISIPNSTSNAVIPAWGSKRVALDIATLMI